MVSLETVYMPEGSPMKNKILFTRMALCLVIVFALAFIVLVTIGGTEAKTITVDDDGGADYTKIKDAIDASKDGDTIRVHAGDYVGGVEVNKRVSLVGNGSEITRISISLSSKDPVVRITRDEVYISGFSIIGSGKYPNAGISIESMHNHIVDNNCLRNYYGIRVYDSCNNIVSNNSVMYNTYGISLEDGSENTLNNTISNNTCMDNVKYGILLYCSHLLTSKIQYNQIENNTCSRNRYGIVLIRSDHSILSNNTCISNSIHGVHLSGSSYTTLSSNRLEYDKIHIDGGIEAWTTNTIEIFNTVNGRPLYFYKNTSGIMVPPGAGQIIIANCSDMRIENYGDSSIAIEVGHSSYVTISNNTSAFFGYHGIYIHSSQYSTISNNRCLSSGIYLYKSSYSSILNNSCSDSSVGITLSHSHHNTVFRVCFIMKH